MNNVYFAKEGEAGMASTTGSFYANICKEMIQAATERLNNIKFYDLSVAVIGSDNKQLMSAGNTSLDFIEQDLHLISEMTSFIAWVREAIKEKDAQQLEIDRKSLETWAKDTGVEMPVQPSWPKDPKNYNEKDVKNSWDKNKLAKYLFLESSAAAVGKIIHPDGAYSDARKALHTAVNNPITKEGTGRDMLLYYKKPSVDVDIVDTEFLKLQELHREYEKELNFMKAELKDTMNEWNRKAYAEYEKLEDEYQVQMRSYNSEMNNLRVKFQAWRNDENERIAKLKITIPDRLKDTFKKIKEVGDASK